MPTPAGFRLVLSGLAVLAVSACDMLTPAALRPPPVVPVAPPDDQRSAQSQQLASYYATVERDLLTQGLLRIDGGGPDTPYTADMLARNFETIAFFDEYDRAAPGQRRRAGTSGHLSRWEKPVRIGVEFGPSVAKADRQRDRDEVARYAARLARVTGHPVSVASRSANFHVFVAGADDSGFVRERIQQLIPRISPTDLNIFTNPPRSFYCLVVAISDMDNPDVYTKAVALIRAEHPELVRRSCIHEEIAQGLGLPNDSPRARPSIFNDDDEFALLTTHDERMLALLYDPRLKPGLTADEARPVVRIIARELMGQEL